MPADATETAQEGHRGKHLEVKHPYWRAKVIGAKIYQFAMIVLRALGNESNGRKINSRGGAEEECGVTTWEKGAGWGSVAGIDWFLAPKEGVLQSVLAAPF